MEVREASERFESLFSHSECEKGSLKQKLKYDDSIGFLCLNEALVTRHYIKNYFREEWDKQIEKQRYNKCCPKSGISL